MVILLGALAFAVMILAQLAAVVAAHRERENPESETLAQPHCDYRALLIWHFGD